MEYEEIRKSAVSCRKCPLHASRKNIVFGDGSLSPKCIVIGEAPGANEDIQGLPFVGKAGKFLNELLNEAGLIREEVYITNIIKCRPPNNRDPLPDEISACYPHLDFQINYLKPKIIVTLGRHAGEIILKKYGLKFSGISTEHGQNHLVNTLYGKISIITMYHPAASIYNQSLKQTILDDFRKIRDFEK